MDFVFVKYKKKGFVEKLKGFWLIEKTLFYIDQNEELKVPQSTYLSSQKHFPFKNML